MQKITSLDELREAILLLEIKQANEGVLLKEQFKITYESLKPVNIIKTTLKSLTDDSAFKGELLNTTASIAAGYFSKKAAIGNTHNPIKQLLGNFLQMGVTHIVSKNADGIKSKVIDAFKFIFGKKNTVIEE